MKTITPIRLQSLIEKGNVELIDVRPKKDFKKVHAQMARSIPLSEFEPHAVLAHRRLDAHAPLYLMCRRKTLATLAACGLTGAGLDEPILIEGGLEAWEKQGLPVVRQKSWRIPVMDALIVTLLGALVIIGLALASHGFFILVALFVFTAWVVLYACLWISGSSYPVNSCH